MPADATRARAYLDYAATAPFDARLADVLQSAPWGNANGLYSEGRTAMAALEDARARIAAALGAHAPGEIIFTSGGTESDNTALHGLAAQISSAKKTHVVVSAIEHDAVLNSAAALKREGFKVDKLKPDAEGVVQPDALEELLARIEDAGDACCLVAVMAVNNELGTVQPVRELAKIAHAHKARFFADAVQALGKLDIDLEASGVDAASFSAHKIGALKGVGALYLRRGVRCPAYLAGGGQEGGMRSGTQNVPGALAFARAVELAMSEREEVWGRCEGFKARILDACARGGFAHGIAPTLVDDVPCVPHVVSLLVDDLEGETLVLRADNAGIAVSAGSACSSGSLEPSHVLTAVGVPRDRAFGSLRVSFGAGTTDADVDAFINVLGEVLR